MPKPKETTPLFEEPEFDEVEYIRSERNRSVIVMFIFLIGALAGLLAGYLQLIGYTYLSVLLFFVIAIFLGKILTSMGFKLPQRTSHKAINYLIFFAVFLLFWIIFLNPPVHTVSAPQVVNVQALYNGHYVTMTSTSNIYEINTSLTSVPYMVHMSYRYNFTVTSLTYTTGGVSSASVTNFHQVGDNVYFNQTIIPTNGQYYFYVHWQSSHVSVNNPVEFIFRTTNA
ncbi:MAG: hypothetical protein M1592_00470 [Candidatus Thermoplasmatota archaeon]|nr:hypothetical protein [Candidatus Thermoplasmatota archaeon]MCL5881044.1 hypothetical protein [Candidatus Thermoplasmatota archaeon]